jgi:membrane-associated phospholipid phosphatase
MKKTTVYILLLLISWQRTTAQPVEDTVPVTGAVDSVVLPPYKLNRAYVKDSWQALKYTAGRPLKWKGKDWAKFGLIIGSTGGLMAMDWEIRHRAKQIHSPFASSVANTVEPLGNFYGLYVFPAVYVAGELLHHPEVASIGLRGAQSLAISTVIYTAAKKVIRRRRPDEAASPFDYRIPFAGKRYTSSPSGHSNTIFTVATVLATEFHEHRWVPWTAYSVATLTALSRVYHNRHWSSDIFLGSLLGHYVTKAVYHHHREKKKTILVP